MIIPNNYINKNFHSQKQAPKVEHVFHFWAIWKPQMDNRPQI